MQVLFGIDLLEPSYCPGRPYIACQFKELSGESAGDCKSSRYRPLDLASMGCGMLQVLLLLAFLYARPSVFMLLDEPDAHQDVILQRDVYARLLKVARERKSQVLMVIHSPANLDATEPERVLAFGGQSPRPLRTDAE